MFDLTDKTALVTGATGGIGGAIARALHKQGATVAISGRQAGQARGAGGRARRPRARAALRPRRQGAGGQAHRRGRSPSSGGVDILVNNAGLTKDNLFMVMKDEQWDEVIAVNLTSTFMLMRAPPAP